MNQNGPVMSIMQATPSAADICFVLLKTSWIIHLIDTVVSKDKRIMNRTGSGANCLLVRKKVHVVIEWIFQGYFILDLTSSRFPKTAFKDGTLDGMLWMLATAALKLSAVFDQADCPSCLLSAACDRGRERLNAGGKGISPLARSISKHVQSTMAARSRHAEGSRTVAAIEPGHWFCQEQQEEFTNCYQH